MVIPLSKVEFPICTDANMEKDLVAKVRKALLVLSVVFTSVTLPLRPVMSGLPIYGVVVCIASVTVCALPGNYSCCVGGGTQ